MIPTATILTTVPSSPCTGAMVRMEGPVFRCRSRCDKPGQRLRCAPEVLLTDSVGVGVGEPGAVRTHDRDERDPALTADAFGDLLQDRRRPRSRQCLGSGRHLRHTHGDGSDLFAGHAVGIGTRIDDGQRARPTTITITPSSTARPTGRPASAVSACAHSPFPSLLMRSERMNRTVTRVTDIPHNSYRHIRRSVRCHTRNHSSGTTEEGST